MKPDENLKSREGFRLSLRKEKLENYIQEKRLKNYANPEKEDYYIQLADLQLPGEFLSLVKDLTGVFLFIMIRTRNLPSLKTYWEPTTQTRPNTDLSCSGTFLSDT